MTNCGFSFPVVSLCAIFPFIPQVWNILRHFSFLLFLVRTELKKAVFPAGRMHFGRLRDPPHFGSSAAASKLSSSYSVLWFCLRSQVAVLSITSLASLILLAGFYNSHWFGNEIIPVDQFVVSVDSQVLELLHHIHFLPQHRHHSFSHPLSLKQAIPPWPLQKVILFVLLLPIMYTSTRCRHFSLFQLVTWPAVMETAKSSVKLL